jgi:hypothetical protein
MIELGAWEGEDQNVSKERYGIKAYLATRKSK